MYQFTVSGPGNYALVAEVFAGRIGSPLDPGVSLFELDPSDGSLQFIAGNNNTYDPVETTDGLSTPLYTDSALYASLTAGVYYLAVADGSNTPSPFEGQPPGSPGLFDPNVPNSAQNGWSTGPYVLNVLVQPAPDPPHVVSTSPSNGATLTQPPSQLTVTFDEPVNLAQLAFQTYQVSGESTLASVYIEGADGTEYFPRFESYDSATNQATFIMLNALPNGDYQLHLSGSAGLTDLGGNELVGNDPDGDYVVSFTVDGPARGTGGNPLEWSDQEPNDTIQDPQDLGVLFPDDLAAGVTITRDFLQDPSQAPQDTADVYEFQILLGGMVLLHALGHEPARQCHVDADRFFGAERADHLDRRDPAPWPTRPRNLSADGQRLGSGSGGRASLTNSPWISFRRTTTRHPWSRVRRPRSRSGSAATAPTTSPTSPPPVTPTPVRRRPR